MNTPEKVGTFLGGAVGVGAILFGAWYLAHNISTVKTYRKGDAVPAYILTVEGGHTKDGSPYTHTEHFGMDAIVEKPILGPVKVTCLAESDTDPDTCMIVSFGPSGTTVIEPHIKGNPHGLEIHWAQKVSAPKHTSKTVVPE